MKIKPVTRSRSVPAIVAMLAVATCVEWCLGSANSPGAGAARASTVTVLVIAFLKARVVGMHFMELNMAPTALRALFVAYLSVLATVLVGFYLIA